MGWEWKVETGLPSKGVQINVGCFYDFPYYCQLLWVRAVGPASRGRGSSVVFMTFPIIASYCGQRRSGRGARGGGSGQQVGPRGPDSLGLSEACWMVREFGVPVNSACPRDVTWWSVSTVMVVYSKCKTNENTNIKRIKKIITTRYKPLHFIRLHYKLFVFVCLVSNNVSIICLYRNL